MIDRLLLLLEKNLSNAASLLTLSSSMNSDEESAVNSFIEEVLDNTVLSDLKEKDVLVYMKLYLKTRKEAQTGLEELINDTQRERLERL